MKEEIKLFNRNTVVWNPNKEAPVLLAFHGSGEASTNINKLYGNGFPQLFSQGWIPPKDVFIICPQAPYGAYEGGSVSSLLEAVKEKYPLADITKVYTTGYSFGGQTVMESLTVKPLHAFPMSAAGGGNTMVNFVAENKIPITHWVGSLETDNIGWTLYQINQLQPNLVKTISRPNVGHCCWNDILQSTEFWDLISTPPVIEEPTPSPEPEPTPEIPFKDTDIVKVVCGEYLTGYILNNGKLFINKWSDSYSKVECADTGLTDIIDGVGGQYDIMVVDKNGQPTVVSVNSSTLKIVKTTAPVTGASSIFNLFGAYFAVCYNSLYTWGIDRLKVGATNSNAVKLNMPSGKTIVSLTGASSTGLSDFTIYGHASDGTVWKWTGLATSQVIFPGNVAKKITTVGPYAIVVETETDLYGWGGYNPSVIGLAWNQKTPISIKKQYTDVGAVFPLKQLIGNYNSLHVIDANGNHFAQGNQVQGEVGVGEAKNYKNSNKTYEWDWAEFMYQPVTQIGNKWKELFSSPTVAFYWYGINTNNNLFSWGRNKTMALGNGKTLPAFSSNNNGYDKRPNAMDVPSPSYVTPLTQLWEIITNFNPDNPPVVKIVPEPENSLELVVYAGDDIISKSRSVNLKGSVTNGNYKSVEWSIISYPEESHSKALSTIDKKSTLTPRFLTMVQGEFIVRLQVNGEDGKSYIDDLRITINPKLEEPVPEPPVVKEIGRIVINDVYWFLLDNNTYLGTLTDIKITIDNFGSVILTEDGKWIKK